MSTAHRIVIEGESYLSLETIADCYHIEVVRLREAYGLGLLGHGRDHGGTIVVATRHLDRVAEIVRLHVYHRLDLDVIGELLPPEDS